MKFCSECSGMGMCKILRFQSTEKMNNNYMGVPKSFMTNYIGLKGQTQQILVFKFALTVGILI